MESTKEGIAQSPKEVPKTTMSETLAEKVVESAVEHFGATNDDVRSMKRGNKGVVVELPFVAERDEYDGENSDGTKWASKNTAAFMTDEEYEAVRDFKKATSLSMSSIGEVSDDSGEVVATKYNFR